MEPILKVSDINVYYGAIHAIKGALSVSMRSISRPILPYPMIAAFILFHFPQRYE